MAEYISREAAKAAMKDVCRLPDGDCNGECHLCLCKVLDEIPAADVVEVVRCGECAWWLDRWQVRNELGEWHYCANVGAATLKDFYCAYGEKRQESEDEE